jgi:hypothetical protein
MDGRSDTDEQPPALARGGVLIAIVFVAVLLSATVGFRRMDPAFKATIAAVDATLVSDGWADEQSCGDCHEQAEDFWQTGHANTLIPASESDSVRLLQHLQASAVGTRENARVQVIGHDVQTLCVTDGVVNSAKLSWCFGSGAQARTWVATLPDSFGATDLLELRWTWFHSTNSFDLTPGHPDEKGHSGVGTMGLLFDGPRAWRCFACHSTRLPVYDGQINESHIAPGVTCQRCHGPRRQHVESEGVWRDLAWIAGNRDDAVRRCAQCHRPPEEQKPEEIQEDNVDIVRFQPVGLSQSACFKASQMTCTTCHNPHKPLDKQDSKGIWQCIQCHSPERIDHVVCGAGMNNNCLQCHMPSIRHDAPVSFTDHWIRVREQSEIRP